ncbi:CarD family transcriptional regulator [Heliorestis acidaminivorans]|uniref:CarD family transcriptional regulator n=1 Tax=Heliorestis acidaminivorans TaxID=553427 RepID=A0A6I0F264_9FIRM|nr:CarD family transcriptional regulator [Heliorestis acidaminivorans]KAB2951073.1 CarD family transcriptional regulator [Heliorestis acidaminivorans]
MFQIGEKILYPMYGACVVHAIEEKEVLGKSQTYYIVNIHHNNMQVMFPCNNVEKLGVRPVVEQNVLDNVLNTLHDGETDATIKATQRNRHYLNKMKSGNIYEGAEVIRDLVRLNNNKKLGFADKNMLDNAREILTSEVQLVKGITHQKASELLNEVVNI